MTNNQRPSGRKPGPCAACGAPRPVRKTTFLIGYGKHAGEYHICKRCWSVGENDVAWNDRIEQAIIGRLSGVCCTVWFRAAGMRKRERCSLPIGHVGKQHEHHFPTWIARVWPRRGGGLEFMFSAKPGKRLPAYLDK